MRADFSIREYAPRDRDGVLECVAELLDYEGALEPTHYGGRIAPAHLGWLLQQCAARGGRILVGLREGRVRGYVCAWMREPFGEHLARPEEAAYVSDLVVRAEERGSGLGRALLQAAEAFVGERDGGPVTLIVLARNAAARRFYSAAGYREFELRLVKGLD